MFLFSAGKRRGGPVSSEVDSAAVQAALQSLAPVPLVSQQAVPSSASALLVSAATSPEPAAPVPLSALVTPVTFAQSAASRLPASRLPRTRPARPPSAAAARPASVAAARSARRSAVESPAPPPSAPTFLFTSPRTGGPSLLLPPSSRPTPPRSQLSPSIPSVPSIPSIQTPPPCVEPEENLDRLTPLIPNRVYTDEELAAVHREVEIDWHNYLGDTSSPAQSFSVQTPLF